MTTITLAQLECFREMARAARSRNVDAPGLVQLTGEELLELVDYAERQAFEIVAHAFAEADLLRLCVRPGFYQAFPHRGFDVSATTLRAVIQALITERNATT
jgi:hypothetical protein